MEQLKNYLYINKCFNASHYFIVCGNTVIVDGCWYDDAVTSYTSDSNIDRWLHDITGCEYLEFEDDMEISYKWFEDLKYYG